jgi:[acyl-carrier-protein] S-malonyltransferase
LKTVTLLFPGQGSQYVGMGKDLTSPNTFDMANKILDYDLKSICFEGPEEDLKLTANTQPAILAHSIGLLKKLTPILQNMNIKVDRVLGHSIGEYSALVAAGALSFQDAVKAVHLRGKYMQEAVPSGIGKMYAILKAPTQIVQAACEAVSTDTEIVIPANFNENGQTVISGHANACDSAVAWLKENCEQRHMCIELQVSAPFHSSLMMPAQEKLAAHLETIKFNENNINYIANIDSKEHVVGTKGSVLRQNLVSQVSGSVLWKQSLEKLSDDQYFIEVGPGKVLTGLNRKINRTFKTYTLDNGFDGLEEFFQ